MVHRVAAAAACLLLTASCATPPPTRPTAASEPLPPAAQAAAERSAPAQPALGEQPPPPEGSTNPIESIPLKVVMTDQTTDGRVMKVRGKLVNPHAQAVDGARLQIVFLAPTGGEGSSPKVLEIQQKEVNSNISPGGSAAFRWDVESMYLGTLGHFMLVAYPMKLGGQDMPPPDHWQE